MTTYTFSLVDDPLGRGVAFGINDLGQIVGYYLDSSIYPLLDSGGIYTTLAFREDQWHSGLWHRRLGPDRRVVRRQ